MSDFVKALRSGDLAGVRQSPKSDLHNHGMMGGRLSRLSEFYGRPVTPFSNGDKGVAGINEWIGKSLKPVFELPGAFEFMAEAAFIQAKEDGVTVLEMSIDAFLSVLLNQPATWLTEVIRNAHLKIAPGIDFRPELGLSRSLPMRTLFQLTDRFLETGYFRSVDLYDIEDAQPVENFRELYAHFHRAGLKCKAHAGEFGDAESVRKAVELLGLDAVQHGIGAAGSPQVMTWLAERGTILNVSPASNIVLRRAESYARHPLRILYDHGVKVTLSTDDVLLFDAGNSEQFLELYNCGAFSPEELDEIRMNGL